MNASDYRRDGFTVLKRAFTPGWKDEHMQAKLAQWKTLPKDDYRRAARLFGAGASQTFLFGGATIQLAVRELGVVDPIFLTQPSCHVMGVDETWEGVAAHQDWPALQTGLNTVVAWAPFTKVGLDNYPVEFVPGSHLLGVLPAKAGAHYSEVDADGFEFVPIECEVGDVLLFSVFTIHRTRTPGRGFRLAVSHRFEDAADPWYAEHGYSAQRRIIEREIKFTPTAEQVRSAIG